MQSAVVLRVLLLAWVVSIFQSVNGQGDFESFSRDQNYFHVDQSLGLPSSQVYSIHKVNENELLLGTDYGVYTYDGSEFKLNTNTNNVRHSTVFNLRRLNDDIYSFTNLSNQVCVINKGEITCHDIFKDDIRSRVLLSTYEALDSSHVQLNYRLVNEEEAQVVSIVVDVLDPLITPMSYRKLVSTDTTEYVAPSEKGTLFVHKGNDTSIPVKVLFKSVLKVGDNSLFFAGMPDDRGSQGLYFYSIDDEKINKIGALDNLAVNATNVTTNYVWVATNNGIYLIDKIDYKVKHHLLAGESVSHLLEVSEDEFWITTLTNGIFYLDGFSEYWIEDDYRSGVDHIDTYGKEAFYHSGENGNRLTTIDENGLRSLTVDLPFNAINRVRIFGDRKFVVTHDGIHELKGGKLSKFKLIGQETNNCLKDLLVVNDDFYIAACDGLLKFTQNVNGELDFDQFLLVERIHSITQGNDGKHFALTNDGVYKFNGAVGSFLALGQIEVKGIAYADQEDLLYLLTSKNDIHVYSERSEFRKILPADLFIDPDNGQIVDIKLSKNGVLIVGTNVGLIFYDLFSGIQQRIHKLFEKKYLSINDIGVATDKLYIATNKGVIERPHPLEIRKDQELPAVRIRGLVVNDKELAVDDRTSFREGNYLFQIDYSTALSNPLEEISYRYRLNEASDWQTVNQSHGSIEYYSLRPGDYNFVIQGVDSNGPKTNNIDSINFTIKPRWYKSLAFFILLGLAIVLTMLSFFRYLEQQRIGKAELERERDLNQLKALKAQINPHFIANSLNAANGLAIMGDAELANTYLAKLGALFRNILKHSDKTWVSVKEEQDYLQLYVDLENIKHGQPIKLNVLREDINDKTIAIPPLLIQPFVENAIIHGIVPRGGSGNVTVTLAELDAQTLRVSIEDDGVGFSNSKRKTNGEKSQGLSLVRGRLDVLSRRYDKQYILQMNDVESEGEIVGSKVSMTIPMTKLNDNP